MPSHNQFTDSIPSVMAPTSCSKSGLIYSCAICRHWNKRSYKTIFHLQVILVMNKKMFLGEFCDSDSACYVKLEPINNDCNVQTFRFYAFMPSGYYLGKICFLEDQGNAVFLNKWVNLHVKFRTLILSEHEEKQFIHSAPVKISRSVNRDSIFRS